MKTPILEMVVYMDDEQSVHSLERAMRMLLLQRNVDFKEIALTIVATDRIVCSPAIDKRIHVDVVHSAHRSIAKAYNQCIMKTPSPWIMFVDSDDFFPDVYSLSMILNLLPTDEYDILWMERYDEVTAKNGEVFTNVVDDIDRRINGKLFRTNFLLGNGLFFDEEIDHDVGDVFLLTAMSMTDYTRFVKIGTKFIPYAHIRTGQAKAPTASDIVLLKHETNMAIIRNIGKKTTGDFFRQAIMKTICEAYYYTHIHPVTNAKEAITNDVQQLCKQYSQLIRAIKPQDVEVFLDEAQEMALAVCNKAYILYGHEMFFEVDGDPFTKWLNSRLKPSGSAVKKTAKKRKDKVAVFCGTRNVYESMETAAKSLMYHTKMDRIYFMIEDDEFPHELPENVRCINVSDQKWFDPKGKNYKNAWTWMCMMRAAFSKILPDEHQVLSLDVDVVVNDDISELWDIDLADCFFAGVPETVQSQKKKTTYCNFGVIMLNLDKIRKTKMDDTIIASLNRDKWGCPEQDAFNHFCKGNIYPLDSKYNATRAGHITDETDEEKISHYAGIKYWKQFKPFKKFADMSWDEVMK